MKPFKGIEHYKDRSKELFEEAALLDTRPLDKVETNKLEEFWRLSKSDKLLEVLQIIKNILPKKFIDKFNLKEKIYNTTELPFNPEKFSFEGLEGHGGQSRVYLLKSLENNLPSYALKIFRSTYLKRFFENTDTAIESFRSEIKQVKEWYSPDLHDIFLAEYMLKLKDPFTKKEALAVLQPYQTGEIKDIFTDISKDDLITLLNNNADLKNKFIKFTKQTLQHANKTEEVLDLLGDKNLSIISSENNDRLVVLDPHHIYKTSDSENNVGVRCQEKLAYLKSVLNELSSDNANI